MEQSLTTTVTVQGWHRSKHRRGKTTQLFMMGRRESSIDGFLAVRTQGPRKKKLQVTAVCYMNELCFAQGD